MAGAESCIQARIQGPYGGSNLEAAEQQQYSSMLYITGGTGLASVLACLQRCAVQRQSTQAGGVHPLRLMVLPSTNMQDLGHALHSVLTLSCC